MINSFLCCLWRFRKSENKPTCLKSRTNFIAKGCIKCTQIQARIELFNDIQFWSHMQMKCNYHTNKLRQLRIYQNLKNYFEAGECHLQDILLSTGHFPVSFTYFFIISSFVQIFYYISFNKTCVTLTFSYHLTDSFTFNTSLNFTKCVTYSLCCAQRFKT